MSNHQSVDQLMKAAAAISGSLNLKKVVYHALQQLRLLFPECIPLIFLNSSSSAALKLFHIKNNQLSTINNASLGIEDWVFTTGEPIILSSQSIPSFLSESRVPDTSCEVHSITVPLFADQHRIGVIQLFRAANHPSFSDSELSMMDQLVSLLTNALLNAKKFERQEVFNKELEKEIKSTTEQLRLANQGLREADTARSESISMVAHELRTPITSISGFTKLFIDGRLGDLTSEQAEFCEIIKKNTAYIERMIKDLLIMTKLELNKMELRLENYHCQTIIDEILISLKGSNTRDIDRLVIGKIDPNAVIHADKLRIIQVLTNLIVNALKYSPKECSVHVQCIIINDKIKFIISDKGPALTDEQQEKVFDKFYRVNRQEKKSGSGLGLAICKIIIDKHHGQIGITKNEFGGNSFYFILNQSAVPADLPDQAPGHSKKHDVENSRQASSQTH